MKKSGEFRGKSRCNVLREHEALLFDSLKNDNYDNAVAVKEIIKGYFDKTYELSEFPELISEAIGVDDEISSKSVQMKRNRLVKILNRAVLSETRKLKMCDKKIISKCGFDVSVKPDVYYDDGRTIEVIMYRAGKPNVTMNGKKQDASVNNCIELYFMILYGRKLIPAGETRNVRASYYFLRKNTDKSEVIIDNDFFSGDGGNVVYLEDYPYVGGSDARTDLDVSFEEQIEEYKEGVDACGEEDCKACSFRAACRYQKTPDVYEKKSLGAKKGKITPSDAQKEIIDFRKGVCRVNATAGSGKTECMTERGARMFEEGVKPEEMLFITFTAAGAYELKERIVKKCRERNLDIEENQIQAMTFHTFDYGILKGLYEEYGFTQKPMLIDEVRNSVIISQMLEETPVHGLDYMNYLLNMPNCKGALACTMKAFELIKEKGIDVNSADASENLSYEIKDLGWGRFYPINAIDELIDLYKGYDERLKEENLVQFADLELLMSRILTDHPGYLERFGYKHIIVDEFQDTSACQMETIKALIACSSFESLMVVGDDSQSIYAFRNTSQENILHFFDIVGEKGEDLYLTENRRSTPEILSLANAINNLNTEKLDKEMIAVRENGKEPLVKGFHSKKEEHEYIAANIKHIIDKGDYPAEDIAFLAMTKSELVSVASELSKLGVPWIMKNPMPLQENSRVQAAMSLAEAFYQPDAEILYFNYLVAKYDGSIFEVDETDIIAEVKAMREQFENMDLLEIGYQREIFHNYLNEIKGTDELYEYFLNLVYENEDFQSELEYIHNFRIFGERVSKKMEQSYAGVVLTTAHSSKGLEWPVCFVSVSGFDSERLHKRGKEAQKEIEERRRLLFVAITRARDLLAVTGQYVAYGPKDNRTYNQFLQEVIECTNMEYDPIDHIADMKAEINKAKKSKSSGTMSPEAIAEYERLIKNAEQMTFAF